MTPHQCREIYLFCCLFFFFRRLIVLPAEDVIAAFEDTPFHSRDTRFFNTFAIPFIVILTGPAHRKPFYILRNYNTIKT